MKGRVNRGEHGYDLVIGQMEIPRKAVGDDVVDPWQVLRIIAGLDSHRVSGVVACDLVVDWGLLGIMV